MTPITTFLLLPLLLLSTPHSISHRILHQPFFPITDPPPPPPPSTTTQPPSSTSTTTTQPPSSPPSQQPKYPFSSQPPPHHHHHHHFFPTTTSPTTVPSTSLPTFPANISTTTTLPPPPPSKSHLSKKLLFLSLSLSLLSILFIAAVAATLLYNRNHHQPPSSDSLRLFPPNLPTSDKPPPPPTPPTLSDNFSTPSSEFLYLGTLLSPKQPNAATIDSPELRPLPPLPRHGFRRHQDVDHGGGSSTDDTEFFSPKGVEEMQLPQKFFNGRSSKLPPPPPPPPMPPAGLSEMCFPAENEGRKEEGLKPKLKGLHWDKVRASSEKETVWDQLKSSSFRLNEEMMERLFMASSSTKADQAAMGDADMNRVLEPHKSRNIAILLRAFNLTIDEVCQCILQGNVDTLGSELLGSLLKMAPTIEEEDKLKDFNDASPFKLGPAEKFLKKVVDIPFAFKRVDAMLYISNFDGEIDYLNKSFETIESACQQLRNSRMFMKLLEAALKAGNRMNVGTNRGDAHAFKLDTLLKLVDVKGTDGKTTLLHFVVQEIIRAEGCRLSGANHGDLTTPINPQSELCDEVEFRKRGLEVVSSLGGELVSVKKAAAMDPDLLSKEVGRLAAGMTKVREAVAFDGRSGSNSRFSDSMISFLKKAEDDLIEIEGKERRSISMVKETTEYFHGNYSSMEEGQPLRIFMVVRDFLTVLDQVCKEVGKINERTTVGMPMSQTLPSVFPWFNGRRPFDGEDNPTSD